jgi:hypothetical protein
MAKQTINTGTTANDRTGDTLRSSFTKINENFTELYNGAGAGDIGDFVFTGSQVEIAENDLDIITTRAGYDVDADIALEAADDIWINANGDELYLSAANTVVLETSMSSMYPNIWEGQESDFGGTWNATSLEITVPTGVENLIILLDHYLANQGPIHFKTAAGYTNTSTSAVSTAETSGGFKVYTIPISATSPSANVEILSMKVFDSINGSNAKTWTLRKDGITEFPGAIKFPINTINLHNGGDQDASVLQFNDPNYQAVITGPTPTGNNSAQRLIIQGQRGSGTGEGGDVYFWGGDAQTNGGDIKIYAGDADSTESGQGGYVNIDGGNGFNNGGDVSISAGNSTTQGGSVFIGAGYGIGATGAQGGLVQVSVSGGAYNWIFNQDGNFLLAGGLVGNDLATENNTYTDTTIELNVNKTVNKITPVNGVNNHYHLADGVPGQIMYIVASTGGETSSEDTCISFDHARWTNGNGIITEGTNVTGWMPFRGTSTGSVTLTLVYVDDHWNLPHNNFD